MIQMLAGIDLANRPALQFTHKWFNTPDPTILITVFSLLGLIALALLIAAIWQRIRDWKLEPAQRQPMALFRRLQKQLKVPRLQRWRLWFLARRLNLPHPAALLISELYFDECVDKLAATRGNQPAVRSRFHHLRVRLFGAA